MAATLRRLEPFISRSPWTPIAAPTRTTGPSTTTTAIFVIRNKATNAYLQAPSTAKSANIQVTTSYSGAPDTDWDLYAVDPF
jgi:hypothetical protein